MQLQRHAYPTAFPYKLTVASGLTHTEFHLVNEYALREPEPIALLFDFLPGKTGETYVSSERKMFTLGVATGKLSTTPAPKEFLERTMHFPPSESIKQFFKDHGNYDHVFVTNYLRTKLPTLLFKIRNPTLPRAITHGDLFLDNCLWDEGKQELSSVLDFEEVCYEPAILDVAMTILGCCFDKERGEIIESWTKSFIDGYCSIRPLTSLEIELLPDMMDFVIIVAAFWRFNQFVVLHPELNMQESYRELSDRMERDKNFPNFWRRSDTQTWLASLLNKYRENVKTYESTRGGLNARGLSFKSALFTGYAPDLGLFVPSSLPRFTVSDLQSMKGMSYTAVVKRLLPEFISSAELERSEIEAAIDSAFSSFAHPDVLPLVKLPSNDKRKAPIHIMEMFHGPTGAFKDLSMQIIGKLMQALLNKDKASNDSKQSTNKTIVVGTSGDTGSAAIYAIRDCPNIDIVVLYPEGRVSRVQELQMVTEQKAHVFAVEGTSDDLDVPIKNVLADASFTAEHSLCSINSINLARVALQSAHFIYAYVNLVDNIGSFPLIASIPCGACGDLVGAIMAREMGVPLVLVAAVNENDILARTMATGVFRTVDHVEATTSPSMDIQVPYNWERVVYYASHGNTTEVAKFMTKFEENSSVGAEMPSAWLSYLRSFLYSSAVNKQAVASVTRDTWVSDKYVLDPHTAVGVQGYLNVESEVNPQHFWPVVVLATATPHKFEESVKPALQIDAIPNPPAAFQGLDDKAKYSKPMKKGTDWEQLLRQEVMAITNSRKSS